MSSSTGRSHRESRKGKEKRYHEDGYQNRETPRGAYRSAGGDRHSYDQPGKTSITQADQEAYPSQQNDAWTSDSTLQTGLETLSLAPDLRSNYTYNQLQSAAADYPSTHSAATSSSAPSQPAGSASTSTYTTGGYPSYYEGTQSTDVAISSQSTTNYAPAYTDSQVPAASSYHQYPSSYQPEAPTPAYSQSIYTSSTPSDNVNPGQSTVYQASAYPAITGAPVAQAASYPTSPPYASQLQGGTYLAIQDPSRGQVYNQANAYPPQSSQYAPQQSAGNEPTPAGPIQQCTCLGCDLDGPLDKRPRIEEKDESKKPSSSRKVDSSKAKHSSSSKRPDPSKSKPATVSKSAAFTIMDPSGSGCGALYLSDVVPWPRPQKPPDEASEEEKSDYERENHRWREDWRKWRDTSCLCRYGYFNTNAEWVAGNHVRKWLKEGSVSGARPGNPYWEDNNWKAPEQPKPGETSEGRDQGRRRRR